MTKRRIFLILPARNEAKRIKPLLLALKKTVVDLQRKNETNKRTKFVIVVVDDWSTDDTAKIVKSLKIKVIKPSCHVGVGMATITGMNYALQHKADAIIWMDADGQHLPSDLYGFVNRIGSHEGKGCWMREPYQYVAGQRNFRQYPFIKRFGNWAMSGIAKIVTPTGINDAECGFRAITAEAAMSIDLKGLKYDICMDFLFNVWKYRLKHTNVYITVPVYYKNKGTNVSTGIHNILFLIKRRLGL